MQGHRHDNGTYGYPASVNKFGSVAGTLAIYVSAGTNLDHQSGYTGSPVVDGSYGKPRLESGTRPMNVALMYIIKT